MHEYSIVRALVERAEVEARKHGATSIATLRLAIGSQAGIEIDLLRSAFEIARPRTLCDAAELVVRQIDAEWRCRRCDLAVEPGTTLRCVVCGAPARLVAGGDIILEQLELEVADPERESIPHLTQHATPESEEDHV